MQVFFGKNIEKSKILSKILSHSKSIRNAKNLSVFGENNSHHLSNFLQTHIFWKFDHISKTYNQINYRNIWFAKVTIILLMIAQVLFLIFFSKKTHTLMSLSFPRPPVFTGELNLVVKNQTAFWRNFDSLPLSVKVMFPWWRKHSILKIIKWKPNLKVSIIHYVFSKLFAVLPQEWIGSQCMIVWYIFKSWHTF